MKVLRKNKSTIIQFMINLSAIIIFWGGLLRTNINADTLCHMYESDVDIWSRIQDGRYLIAVIDTILINFGIRVTDNIRINNGIVFFLLGITLTILQKIFSRWEPEKFITKIGFYGGISLCFLNILFAEPLMFSEVNLFFALSFLAAVLGSFFFSKRKNILSFVFFFITTMFYQYSVIFSAVILIFFCILDEEFKWSPKLILREIHAIGQCMFAGVLNLGVVKLLDLTGIVPYRKTISVSDWGQKLVDVAKTYLSLFVSGQDIFPNSAYVPALFTLVSLVLLIAIAVKEKKISESLMVLTGLVVSLLLIMVIPLLNGDFQFPNRFAYLFFFIQGLFLSSVMILGENINLKKTTSIAILCYLLIHNLFISFILEDRFVANRWDINEARLIVDEIEKYEMESGNTVTKLARCSDGYAPDFHQGLSFHSYQINERIMTQNTRYIILYSTGRDFEYTEMDNEIYESYFKDHDWDRINLDEQLVCKGDTAYICFY